MSEKVIASKASRVVRRAGEGQQAQSKDAVFSVAARVVVYILVVITMFIGVEPIPSIFLSLGIVVLMFITGHKTLAKYLLGFALFLFITYSIFFIFDIRIYFLAPRAILEYVARIPIMAAFLFVASAPVGWLSAAMARIHAPKKIIVGVLVAVRFFPTVASFWRRYSDATKTRNLLSIRSIIKNPLALLEYTVIPVLFALSTSADQLSTSAIARAAESPHPRSSYYERGMTRADIFAIVAIALICAASVAASITLSKTGVL